MPVLEQPVLMNEDQLADFLTVQPQTLSVWRLKGIGPRYVKVGRLVRYRAVDVEKWLESRTQATAAK